MYKTTLLTLHYLFFTILTLCAQAPPKTNIYLFQLEQLTDSLIEISQPRFLTHFNSDGYNNQPYFFNDNELYFTSQQPLEEQPDIYALDLEKRVKTQIIATSEGEYSPTLMLNTDHFSVVRVEADEAGTQRLWEFPVNRSTNGKPVFKYITGIGYHHWLNSTQVALFMVGEPHSLAIADTRTDKTTTVAENIGRCFQALPSGNMAFVHKEKENNFYIKSFNPYTRKVKKIVQTKEGAEDFAVLSDGTLVMGKGSKLYKYHPAYDTNWLKIADLRYYNIRKITRLAVSDGNQLAIVSE